jgi:cyclophilin family peptidyl-prolyl cis-trans isomerase
MLRACRRVAVLTTLLAPSLAAQRPWHPDTAALQRLLVAEDARGTGADGITPLVNALQSPDTLLRRVAVRGLGRLQRPELGREIEPLLADAVPAIRAAAAEAMAQSLNRVRRRAADPGQGEVSRAAVALAAALDVESDSTVAESIAGALGRLPFGDSLSAGPAESAILHHVGDHPGFGAARALYFLALNRASTGGLSPSAVTALRDAINVGTAAEVRRVAVLALIAARALDSGAVNAAWRDPDEQVRRLGLAGVLALPAEQRTAMVRAAFADPSAIVRIAAIGAARAGERLPDCSPIIAATRDPAPYVAQVALDSLGAPCANATAAIAALRAVLEAHASGRAGVVLRSHALVAWAHRGDLPLARYATASTPAAQVAIAQAAALMHDTAVLVRLTRSADHNVREAAITGLSSVVKHGGDSAFVAALSSPGYQVVRAAAMALKGTDDRRVLPALLDNLDRITREQRENSRDARLAILARVDELGSQESAARVTPYLADFDTLVATTAAKALSGWSGNVVTARPLPLPIASAPLAATFLRRHVDLAVTMADGGTFTVRLDAENAPATAARILHLVAVHYYDGHVFQRVEPNFVVQGGGPDANEYVGDAQFMRDELSPRSHLRGTLGISSRGRDTGDAQWFFNLTDNTRLDHEYTVFGEVTAGEDVVERILEGSRIRSVVKR